MGDKQVSRKRARSRLEKMASKARSKQAAKREPAQNKKGADRPKSRHFLQ
jgi:hypothetical protein